MNKRILTVILAAAMTATTFGTACVANAAPVAQAENQGQEFKIEEPDINGCYRALVYTDEELNFTTTSTGAQGKVTYQYLLSDGIIDSERTEIPAQGYKFTEAGDYLITVVATDESGNKAYSFKNLKVEFKITGNSINGVKVDESQNTTVKANRPLYFATTNTSTGSNVNYTYAISDFPIDAERTVISQGYAVKQPGLYRISIHGVDAKGNTAFDSFFINVVE